MRVPTIVLMIHILVSPALKFWSR